jgi:ABC-type phosphate transport system substrate-binding protein
MKTIETLIITGLALFLSISVFAETKETKEIIYIGGVKFTYPIIEKWISEYEKENPSLNVHFELNTSNKSGNAIEIVAHTVTQAEENVSYLGRYALLPVSNINNPLLNEIKKGFNKKQLKELVFEANILDDDYEYGDQKKDKYNAVIYSRDSKSSTAIALASYFGEQPEEIKGKKIFGDEIFLINAVQKDINGVTFNSLNYIFDIDSRKLKSDLALLPLNLKSQQNEVFNSKDIDQAIALLEKTNIETIPVEKFGFIIPDEYAENPVVIGLVTWILEKGQGFNNNYGFLKLGDKTLAEQKDQLKEKLFSYSR